LELFFNDENRYPTVDEWNTGKIFSTTTSSTSTYMQVIPTAPTPADGNCSNSQNNFSYNPNDDGSAYSISFCLGGNTGTLSANKKCATPSGILDHSCCFGSVAYGGQNYDLVEIGDQCWFKENLDIGTMLCPGSPNNTYCYEAQTDNSVVEKYCYYNNAVDAGGGGCSTGGGLYRFSEAMQYSVVDGAQGICPTGYHIPSDGEWYVLENYLKDSGQTCDPDRIQAWDCSGAGTKLNAGGSTGFESLAAGGYGFAGSGAFSYWGIEPIFWSSTVTGGNAWMRWINTATLRYADSQTTVAASVRCLKN